MRNDFRHIRVYADIIISEIVIAYTDRHHSLIVLAIFSDLTAILESFDRSCPSDGRQGNGAQGRWYPGIVYISSK